MNNGTYTQNLLADIGPSIIAVFFMVGMVKTFGHFIEPPHPSRKHLPEPVAKVVTVPGGARWKCIKCGKELEPGEKAVKIGGKVYCVPCARGDTETKRMYHTTPLENWKKISKEGLVPQELSPEVRKATGLWSGIYLEESKEEAYGWALMLAGWYLPEEGIAVIKFAILGVEVLKDAILTQDPDVIDIGTKGAPTSFIVTQSIPPESVHLLDVTEVEVG